MQTKIELTLEQSQQSVSNDVLAETGSIHNLSKSTEIVDIEDAYGPSDAMHNPSQPFEFSKTNLSHLSWRYTRYLLTSHSENVDIE
ncbi:hypothetical protein Tco_0699734 [Tanacetum coccineum]